MTPLSIPVDDLTRQLLQQEALATNRAPEAVASEVLVRWRERMNEHHEEMAALDIEAQMLRDIFSRP
jgi:hypothetical protein